MVYQSDARRMSIRLVFSFATWISVFVLPGSNLGMRVLGGVFGLMWLAWVPLTFRFRVVLDDNEVRIRRWSTEKVLRRGEWHVKGVMNLSLFRGNTIIQLRSTSGGKVDLPLASLSKGDQTEVLSGVTHALSRPAHR
jgi:hypothetical protein